MQYLGIFREFVFQRDYVKYNLDSTLTVVKAQESISVFCEKLEASVCDNLIVEHRFFPEPAFFLIFPRLNFYGRMEKRNCQQSHNLIEI